MEILTILSWIKQHKNIAKNVILSLAVGFSLLFGISTCRENKKLSESLKIANNNIEAYQELQSSQQASNVLQLDPKTLGDSKDTVLVKMHDTAVDNNIKPKSILTSATQTQTVDVKQGKKIQLDTIHDLVTILKDTVYSDSIKYNDLTTVNYTIGRDTVSIGLKLNNTQYLYIYTKKEWNQKNFWKRLFTFNWKKTTKYKYKIINTNDLLKASDVRVVNAK